MVFVEDVMMRRRGQEWERQRRGRRRNATQNLSPDSSRSWSEGPLFRSEDQQQAARARPSFSACRVSISTPMAIPTQESEGEAARTDAGAHEAHGKAKYVELVDAVDGADADAAWAELPEGVRDLFVPVWKSNLGRLIAWRFTKVT